MLFRLLHVDAYEPEVGLGELLVRAYKPLVVEGIDVDNQYILETGLDLYVQADELVRIVFPAPYQSLSIPGYTAKEPFVLGAGSHRLDIIVCAPDEDRVVVREGDVVIRCETYRKADERLPSPSRVFPDEAVRVSAIKSALLKGL